MGEVVLQVCGRNQGSQHSPPERESQGRNLVESKKQSGRETLVTIRTASSRS